MRAFLIAVVLASSVVSPPQQPSDDVRTFQQRRFAAMVRQDLGAVATAVADDLTYTHTSGDTETKVEFLETLRSRRIVYEQIEPTDVGVRRYGDTAVVTGWSTMHIRADGQPATFQIRFLEVDVRRSGRWQMVAWQATRLPT